MNNQARTTAVKAHYTFGEAAEQLNRSRQRLHQIIHEQGLHDKLNFVNPRMCLIPVAVFNKLKKIIEKD